jgi:hypothetical protein
VNGELHLTVAESASPVDKGQGRAVSPDDELVASLAMPALLVDKCKKRARDAGNNGAALTRATVSDGG